jgi:hypothetical protein
MKVLRKVKIQINLNEAFDQLLGNKLYRKSSFILF